MLLLTAPLGMTGVAAVPAGLQPAVRLRARLLGVIALAGMIMRNMVILADQIDQDNEAGHTAWDAMIDATVRRARPIPADRKYSCTCYLQA